MKNSRSLPRSRAAPKIARLFADGALAFAAALSLLANLSALFVTSGQFAEALPAAGLAAAVLLLLLSLRRAFCAAALSVCFAAAAGLGVWQLRSGGPESAVWGIQAAGGLTMLPMGQIKAVFVILACLLALLLFCMAKSRPSLAFAWAAGTAAVLAEHALGYEVSLPLLLAFSAACAVSLMRRGRPAPPPGLTLAALALCAAAAVSSQYLFTCLQASFGDRPRVTLPQVGRWVSDSLQPVKSGFGDESAYGRLGRPMTLDGTPVLEAKAGGPFYLKGRVYDTYNGSQWLVSTPPLEYDSETGVGFAGYSPSFYRHFLPGGPIRTMRVTALASGLRYLPVPSRFFDLTPPGDRAAFGFSRFYPDLMLQTPLAKGESYKVNYLETADEIEAERTQEARDAEKAAAAENAAAVAAADGKALAAGQFTAEENNILQTLPDSERALLRADMETGPTVTLRTRELALRITKNCRTAVEKADAVKAWLDAHCAYTLNPRQPFANADFVDFFLFSSHAGYCEHFATAMTVLLRASGVPARFVRGYCSPSANAAGDYVVTNAQAHAWVEFYTAGRGFLLADPTPAGAVPAAAAPGAASSSRPSASSKPSPSAPSSSSKPAGSPAPRKASSAAPSPAAHRAGRKAAKAGAAGAAAGIAVLLLLLYGGAGMRHALQRRRLRRLPPLPRAVRAYAVWRGALTRLGYACPPEATPQEYAAALRGRARFLPVPFEKITRIYEAARFGGHAPEAAELEALAAFGKTFWRCCRRSAGTPAFLLRYPFL